MKLHKILVLLLLFAVAFITVFAQNPQGFPNPTQVVLAGTFQSELGCPGDWQPDCTKTALSYDAENDVWTASYQLPAGNYEYKIALDGSWQRNYGANGLPDGPNIALAVAETGDVAFVYDHKTGLVGDSINGIPETKPASPTETPNFVTPYFADIFLRGTMNDWGSPADYKMNLVADNSYALEVNLAAQNYELKIASANWSTVDEGATGSDTTLNLDQPYSMSPVGANLNLTIESSGNYTFTLDVSNAKNPVLTVSKTKSTDVVDDVSQRKLYLRGTMNNWGTDSAYLFTRDGDIASLELDLSAGVHYFKIADEQWTTSTNFGLEKTALVGSSTVLTASNDSRDALLVMPEAGHLRFVLDMSDLSHPVLTIEGKIGTSTRRAPSPKTEFNNLRIYEVMVESFIDGDPNVNYGTGYGNSPHRGDLRGIIEALPYIKSLGMNAIWLTPIFDSEAGTGNDARLDATGYFTRNYFKIDPNFGTLDDARELVNTAHQLGMYVFFDGVFGHHKANVEPSPNGNLPAGPNNPVKYPESLAFYKEVATYWIDELGIDGWRLDQAYQVPQAAWIEIRHAVEEKAAERKAAGEEWGTLGYMVAEDWRDTPSQIAAEVYGSENNPVLYSAFDFPTRYALVRVLAGDEGGTSRQPASTLDTALLNDLNYPSFAAPNLMMGNHDLVRFGDLLQRAGIAEPNQAEYWQRHKLAFSFLAAYSGPITIYYDEEIGAEVPNFAAPVNNSLCAGMGLCDDHVSRSSGKISGFTPQEENLKDYVTSLMNLRAAHESLWNGNAVNLIASDTIFADYKFAGNDHIVYILNVSPDAQTITISQDTVGGTKLHDLLGDSVIEASNGNYEITVEGLTPLFLAVTD